MKHGVSKRCSFNTRVFPLLYVIAPSAVWVTQLHLGKDLRGESRVIFISIDSNRPKFVPRLIGFIFWLYTVLMLRCMKYLQISEHAPWRAAVLDEVGVRLAVWSSLAQPFARKSKHFCSELSVQPTHSIYAVRMPPPCPLVTRTRVFCAVYLSACYE